MTKSTPTLTSPSPSPSRSPRVKTKVDLLVALLKQGKQVNFLKSKGFPEADILQAVAIFKQDLPLSSSPSPCSPPSVATVLSSTTSPATSSPPYHPKEGVKSITTTIGTTDTALSLVVTPVAAPANRGNTLSVSVMATPNTPTAATATSTAVTSSCSMSSVSMSSRFDATPISINLSTPAVSLSSSSSPSLSLSPSRSPVESGPLSDIAATKALYLSSWFAVSGAKITPRVFQFIDYCNDMVVLSSKSGGLDLQTLNEQKECKETAEILAQVVKAMEVSSTAKAKFSASAMLQKVCHFFKGKDIKAVCSNLEQELSIALEEDSDEEDGIQIIRPSLPKEDFENFLGVILKSEFPPTLNSVPSLLKAIQASKSSISNISKKPRKLRIL